MTPLSASEHACVQFIAREAEVPPYSPANHTGTTNRRLIGPGAVEAEHLEVLRGTIEPGSSALPHQHPGIEQVCYVLSGSARAELDGRVEDLEPRDCCYFPANTLHTFTATGTKPVEILVIYSPPYGEQLPSRANEEGAA